MSTPYSCAQQPTSEVWPRMPHSEARPRRPSSRCLQAATKKKASRTPRPTRSTTNPPTRCRPAGLCALSACPPCHYLTCIPIREHIPGGRFLPRARFCALRYARLWQAQHSRPTWTSPAGRRATPFTTRRPRLPENEMSSTHYHPEFTRGPSPRCRRKKLTHRTRRSPEAPRMTNRPPTTRRHHHAGRQQAGNNQSKRQDPAFGPRPAAIPHGHPPNTHIAAPTQHMSAH